MNRTDFAIESLTHADATVRNLAIRYLKHVRHPQRITADTLLDRLDARPELASELDQFEATPRLYGWVMQGLRDRQAGKALDELGRWQLAAAHELPISMLTRDDAELIDRVSGASDLLDAWELHQAWSRQEIGPILNLFEAEIARLASIDTFMSKEAGLNRLIAHLVSRRDEVTPWLVEQLGSESDLVGWRLLWLIELAAQLNLRQGLHALHWIFAEIDFDFDSHDALLDSLSRLIAAAAEPLELQAIVATCRSRPEPILQEAIKFLACELIDCRLDATREVVLDLASMYPDDESIVPYCAAVLIENLFADDASWNFVLATALRVDVDQWIFDLPEETLALATLTGRVVDDQTRSRLEFAQKNRSLNDGRSRALALIEKSQRLLAESKAREESQQRYQPAAPLVSTRVGRNDPCPCGSGKKYKKCCLSDEPAPTPPAGGGMTWL